jgi:predicted amidohydrolase YtcJ
LVNRRTASGAEFGPHERITVEQAVHAYTVGSAYAVHEDHRKGRLIPGMLADFVTLSEDIYTVAPERIKDVTVTGTVIGGRPAYGLIRVSRTTAADHRREAA